MSKIVLKTFKMSIDGTNILLSFTDLVVLSAISECKVISLHT